MAFGTSSRLAARMIGVASKNEKRAAASYDKPWDKPPSNVLPEREILAVLLGRLLRRS